MRKATCTLLCFVALGLAANAQRFSLLPQVGFENSRTNISYNDLHSFTPLGTRFTPQASMRLNYASKQGHGFFLGAASSRSVVSFSFRDPEHGMTNFIATPGNMQLRWEGGYLFNTKPISLGRSTHAAVKKHATKSGVKKSHSTNTFKSSCSKTYSYSRCGTAKPDKVKQPSVTRNKNSWVRIQPSVGMGFIPSVKTDVIIKAERGQIVYQYNAGNWNTAVIAGAGFEFGKGSTRELTVSINYFRGLGNLDKKTISTASGSKSVSTVLGSEVSGWSMKVGIPFTLASKNKTPKNNVRKPGCGQSAIIYKCVKKN